MKSPLRLLVATLLFASLVSGVGYAQSTRDQLVCQVPFQFMAQDRVMPAGEYQISWISDTVVRVANARTHDYMLVTVDAKAGRSSESSLTFNKYGSRYFLSLISVAGGRTQVLPVTHNELQARAVAGTPQPAIEPAK